MSFDLDVNLNLNLNHTLSSIPPNMSAPSPGGAPPNPTWQGRYEELLQWRAERGDTCVPKAEGALGRWVARQRELKRSGSTFDLFLSFFLSLHMTLILNTFCLTRT